MNPDSLVLTNEMITVFGVIGVLVTLFVTEWVRVDVVAILAMVALPMLGLVDGQEAFSGFGSSAVISIIAVIILGRGLGPHRSYRTGGAASGEAGRKQPPAHRNPDFGGDRLHLKCDAEHRGGGLVSARPAAHLPGYQALPIQTSHTGGFRRYFGGTITLVGSSPLIILNDLMAPYGLEPFGLFSVTPAGLALVAAGIVYYLLLGKYVLPTTPSLRTAK
jgi:hypothetical protein